VRGHYRIGISGWTYEPWRGTFYPKNVRQHAELAYASRRMNSLEINGTFYSLQRPSTYAAWHDAAPDDFVFAVKAPRFITHIRRLKDCAAPVANFFASGVLRLGPKLGPILWQLPRSFHFDKARIAEFLRLLPRDTREAATIARHRDAWMEERSWLDPGERRPLRHAIEIRHASFNDPAFFRLLERQGIALVIADTAGKWPQIEVETSDFVYARLHGDKELYTSGYTQAALDRWARKFSAFAGKRLDVYAYFDNDVKVRAPYDAMSLAWRLGIGPKPGRAPRVEVPPPNPEARTRWPFFGARRVLSKA